MQEEDEATRNTSEEADVVQFDDSQDQPNDMGFSRSTLQTIKTLQSKFDTQDDGEKELLYNDLTASARRKDAVRLFFELLVLKTKDMVDVKQPEAYGNIMITPKETLYTAITAAT
ncbi:hypothetical protein HK104_008665 [Borealophlyctis nickersoniae]|nr:hypothetical protein HK104_008665 [Borealophlyctis nickersoniae]